MLCTRNKTKQNKKSRKLFTHFFYVKISVYRYVKNAKRRTGSAADDYLCENAREGFACTDRGFLWKEGKTLMTLVCLWVVNGMNHEDELRGGGRLF